jgi:hypothetical protein
MRNRIVLLVHRTMEFFISTRGFLGSVLHAVDNWVVSRYRVGTLSLCPCTIGHSRLSIAALVGHTVNNQSEEIGAWTTSRHKISRTRF